MADESAPGSTLRRERPPGRGVRGHRVLVTAAGMWRSPGTRPAAAAAMAVLLVDGLSKTWALHQPSPDPVTTPGFVQLHRVTNRGASLGLGSQHPRVVVLLAVAATLAVGGWLITTTSVGERVSVAVLLGGAVGNLVDRLADGAVTDWLHLVWYPPTFNVADVAIRGGAVAALIMREVVRRRGRRRDVAGTA